MSRYGDDLRKIVGIDEIKRRLKELEDRAEIPAKRGLAYQGADGAVQAATGAAGSSGNGLQAPATALGSNAGVSAASATSAAAAALQGAAQALNPSGAGGGSGITNGALDGVYDLKELIDDLVDVSSQTAIDYLAAGLSANTNTAGFNKKLKTITGAKDCESGIDVDVHLDGFFRPPAEWYTDTPEGAPTLSDFVFGFYWQGISAYFVGPIDGASLTDCGINCLQACIGYRNVSPAYEVTGGFLDNIVDGGSTADYVVQLYLTYDAPNEASSGYATVNIGLTRYSCSSIGVPSASCVATAPLQRSWQPQGKYQLSPNTVGLFEGSPRDTEVPAKYRQPSSTAYLCFEEGTRAAVLAAGINGTKLLYEVNPATLVAETNAIVHVYTSAGQIIGYTDAAKIRLLTPN